jgi:hypothetical protein
MHQKGIRLHRVSKPAKAKSVPLQPGFWLGVLFFAYGLWLTAPPLRVGAAVDREVGAGDV